MPSDTRPVMTGWAAVVLAAGQGVRMNSRLPKVLHPLCGLPMIAWVLRAIRETGVSDITLVVPPDHDALRSLFGDQARYVVQDRPGGTGHAVQAARNSPAWQPSSVLVVNGDLPLLRADTLRRLVKAHESSDAVLALLTAPEAPVEGLGRVMLAGDGSVQGIVEAADAGPEERGGGPVNVGAYAFRASWLWDRLGGLAPSASSGEVYLTSLMAVAASEGRPGGHVPVQDTLEAVGVNTRAHLAMASAELRRRINHRWMQAGVTMPDPATTYIEAEVELGRDTVLHPNTHLQGRTTLGEGCEIGPNAVARDSTVGHRCVIGGSVLEEATLENEVEIGPFCHLRPGAYLERGVHLGNFAEVKAARLGRGVRMGHFSYIGDAEIGAEVNIGAGTITCNFDGVRKNRTIVEEGAFLGSDTMLVAPVRIGARAATGAGAVVTKDVPPDALVVGMPARRTRREPDNARDAPDGDQTRPAHDGEGPPGV